MANLTQKQEGHSCYECIVATCTLGLLFVTCIGFIIGWIFVYVDTLYDNQVRIPRAKALGDDLLAKLGHNWEDVFRCKLNLAEYCNGQMKVELQKQHKLHNHYMDRLTELAKDDWRSYSVVQEMAPNVTKFVDYHQTTQVDICGFDETCTKCLRECIKSWSKRNDTCNSDNAWRVVQYSPDKVN